MTFTMFNVPVLITWLDYVQTFVSNLPFLLDLKPFIMHSAYIKYLPDCKYPTIELNTLDIRRESSDKHVCGENVTNITAEEISEIIKCEVEDGIHLDRVASTFRNKGSDEELEQKVINIQVSEKDRHRILALCYNLPQGVR